MWAALNAGAGLDAGLAQRATQEAQDADNAALYEQALRCQQRKQNAQAKEIYASLLSGDAAVSVRLEYLCHKNLASMELEAQSFENALQYFSKALELDNTDVVVWHQLATTAVETGKLWLARRALEEGFKVDSTYWPLVQTLAEVLAEIGDVEEYERVALYIREKDPQCASVRILDSKKKMKKPGKEERRAQKRLDHLHEVVETAKKKRKVLVQERRDELEDRMRSRKFELQQPTWTALGKVLLEAFEENNRGDHADVVRTEVQIHAGFHELEEKQDVEMAVESGGREEEQMQKEEEEVHPPPVKRPKHKVTVEAATALETSLSTGVSDNDTQDSASINVIKELLQPRRRKSRRNEERLREEHAAAVKKAREKDLAYRLGAFLPAASENEEREAMPEAVAIEWLTPLNVELVDAEFRVSDANKETISEVASFAFLSSSEGTANNVEPSSAQRPSRDQAGQTMAHRVGCVTTRQLSAFLGESDGAKSRRGVLDWLRHFLNQCGEWSHLKLGSDDEDIHRVCTWLEKALNGDLDAAKAATPRQSSALNVADHSLAQGSRFEGNGLTLGAQLFMLELHFDALLQQLIRGKRRRKMRRQVEVHLTQAQKLLFEFGWLEDSEDGTPCPSRDEFLRLLWLIARMYERCGNPQMAQHYFIKCREKLTAQSEEDGVSDDLRSVDSIRIDLPNQKTDSQITLEILDEKISGLRFSDVCSEARRLFEAGDHDSVVSILLGYFFPANQAPRLSDFLQEFEADEDDTPARSEGSKKLSGMVLESLGKSSKFSDQDTVLFLLTALYHVIEFLDGLAMRTEPTASEDSPDEECTNALAAMDFLLTELTQNDSCRMTDAGHKLVLRGLCVRCLQPSILLRFDAPNDVLSMLRTVLEVDSVDSAAQLIGVDAMARLFYTVRSLSSDDFRNLITLVPHPVKRKQPRRDRIRAVLVELLRFLNRAFRSNQELALLFPLSKRAAIMTLCCTMMKEEEEMLARSDAKTPKQLFGNGAILFVLLYESLHRQNPPTVPTQLVDLIQLLHERLGQHGICGMTYCVDTGSSADSSGSACFLESCTLLLSKFVKQKTSVRDEEAFSRKSDDSSADESNEDEDEEEAEYRFQREVCQCYRCLYDVQILPGCDDHKTGATFALLQNAETSVKHEDALRLARFAVPILLATKPKNNGQKKERLKLLYAVREALSDSGFAALSAQPASVSPSLEAYLAPRGLLQEDVAPPLPFDAGIATAKSADEACLDHVWYLLGANFILGRVKRRGNLGELSEMEQHVRERVEFLMKDVLYYHPDRIDSWIRLGKTMKELYHAATDAFAAVLGQKMRIQAFQWYTTKVLAKSPTDGNATDLLSFQNVVLNWNLFKTIKDWQGKDTDTHKAGSKTANSKDPKEDASESAKQVDTLQDQTPIEEYATAYIVQVIEFARRCFDMAARLAEEAAEKHQKRLQAERSSADTAASDGEDAFDEELDELQNKIIECNEESGLLLYNVLQELSLMKEVNLALFPHAVYSRLTRKTLAYFRRGLKICEANDEAHEDHFRLQYMVGKTLKKRRWIELRERNSSDPEALSTAEEMAEFFAKAEASREEGDREHALVHAFYSLQALRIDLTISESPSVSALRLVCKHFYEEEEEDDDDNNAADSGSTKGADEKSNAQEDTAPGATKDASSKDATSPGDTSNANSTKKDEVLALLSDAESDDSARELNVTVARGWLALNIIEALESIPDEDRYFHPSRYVLARIVYWLSTFYSALDQSGYSGDKVTSLLGAVQARRREEKADAAAQALKEMGPIFDKRRPQVVAIWFSEYIPVAKKFEELNQRQMKYDYYRLKYWRFYIALLEENADYGRLKEVGSWVLACKEEHDVIDMMLGIVLHARGKVLRRRLQEFLNTTEDAAVGSAVGDAMNMMTQTQLLPGEDRPVDALLKQLAKTYSYYLEVSNAQQRLARVMDDSGLLLENAELPMVAVFFVGAIAYPSEMPLLEKNVAILDRDFNGNVTVIKNALHRDELPPRIYDAQSREAWKAYLDAARSFCEEKWPERSGKGKTSKKHSRPKASGIASTEASQSTVDGPSQ